MSIPYISVKDAATSMGVSEQRIRTMLRDGMIVGQQVGKTWVVEKQSLKLLVDKKISEYPTDKICVNKKTRSLKAVSFFSGAMGLDIGLERAGIEVVLACELDKKCRQTIMANKPDIALIGDISDYTPEDILTYSGINAGELDIMVGGPPCQAFSTAGNRRGFNDKRGNVLLDYIEMILELRPKYAVIENVRGLLSAPLNHRPHADRDEKNKPLMKDEMPGGALRYIISKLKAGGYGVSFNLYNSANYGVPQIRERVVIICHRDGENVPHLNPTHSDEPSFCLPGWKTLKNVICDLSEENAEYIDFPENRLKYYKMLKAGQYWKHLPVDLQKEALGKSYYSGGGKTGFLRRLSWDKPSCTLVTHPAMPATDICHPEKHRPLSIQEYKRIQQFPDDWVVCGSIIDQYRQIGNAVPVGLGEAIGRAIIDHVNGKSSTPPIGFPYSRYKGNDEVSWEKRNLLTSHDQDDLFSKNEKVA
jgi:DNA (cytosine-5)-methyltransferase 1